MNSKLKVEFEWPVINNDCHDALISGESAQSVRPHKARGKLCSHEQLKPARGRDEKRDVVTNLHRTEGPGMVSVLLLRDNTT